MRIEGKRMGKKKRSSGYGFSTWNTKNAGKVRLRLWLRKRRRADDVAAVLIEVWRTHPQIAKIARKQRWHMLSEAPVPGGRERRVVTEQGDTVLLLHPEFQLHAWDVIEQDEGWEVFSADRKHEGRRHIRAVGDFRGRRFEVVGLHGPTDGNEDAQAEMFIIMARVIERTRSDTEVVILGDFNARLPEVRRWARRLRAEADGQGPDIIVAVDGSVRARTHGRGGSDHFRVSARVEFDDEVAR